MKATLLAVVIILLNACSNLPTQEDTRSPASQKESRFKQIFNEMYVPAYRIKLLGDLIFLQFPENPNIYSFREVNIPAEKLKKIARRITVASELKSEGVIYIQDEKYIWLEIDNYHHIHFPMTIKNILPKSIIESCDGIRDNLLNFETEDKKFHQLYFRNAEACQSAHSILEEARHKKSPLTLIIPDSEGKEEISLRFEKSI